MMRVVKVPSALWGAAGFVLLTVPIAALETVLVLGSPWWDLPLERIGVVSALAACLFIPLSAWITRGRRWALWLTGVIAVTWSTATVVVAVVDRNFWLAVFAVFLAGYWFALWSWLRVELAQSYFDPLTQWYHGAPECLPGLKGRILSSEHDLGVFGICRLDRKGAFLFRSESVMEHPARKVQVRLDYRGLETEVSAEVIRIFGKNQGFGLRFSYPSRDAFKEMGDFVERLKGEGHV